MNADRRLLISCLDLTALGDEEAERSIESLCDRAVRPVDNEAELMVAAVCVWPHFVPLARAQLGDGRVRIATASGGFPVPEEPLAQRVDQIRAAIDAGADFLKTSTGKGLPGATPAAAQSLAELIAAAGRPVGLKVSGGIRGAGQATNYLALVRAVLGPDRPTPATFRIGASALLDALLA